MDAGPQLDSLISRKIWRVFIVTENGEDYAVGTADGAKVPVPKFSTVMEDANRVVGYFRTKGWSFRIQHIADKGVYHGTFFKEDGREYRFYEGKTISHAICMAALAVVNGSNVV